MNVNTEQISEKMNELLGEAAEGKAGSTILSLMEALDGNDFLGMTNSRVSAMTQMIADEMAKDEGVPLLSVASTAHAHAIAHFALLMFATGHQMRSDEFMSAETLTEEDVDAAIASILAGSNE